MLGMRLWSDVQDAFTGKNVFVLLSKVNAYKLFYFDINKIGPDIELESQSINAFMAVIVKDYNSQNTGQAAFIDSFAMTAMWQGKSPRLKKMNPMNYEIILGINNQHHHWTLVFAEKILSKEVVDFPVSNEAVYSMRLEIAIQCDLCLRWFHQACVGSPPTEKTYHCFACLP
ncbi:unnamed protein product [Menidia menidia]|uniref:(Atlantic silverside) hypothetical protein n=1 Tax=Menidia menidia TaxID=238744 RepID=A0A8S4BUX3_9TELE|nr:unnamed protein product [Menidia menidia]